MKVLSKLEAQSALTDMKQELKEVLAEAQDFMEDIKDVKPDDISMDEEKKEPGEKEEHPVEIKTPEDAKKVLEEAKEDITQVVENLEGVMGQGEEEGEKIAYKRMNETYTASLITLGNTAIKAINDAKESLSHWAFLRNRIKNIKQAKLDLSEITDPNLKQVASTVHQVGLLEKALNKIGFYKKEATSVPPTGAEFSGDKWPKGKDPKEVETRQWEAGSREHDKNKKKEDSMPNPATDDRLNDLGNPRGDGKPYVEASYNPVGQYWDIKDLKENKAIRYSFATAPDELGLKTEAGLRGFSSNNYGNTIINEVVSIGIENVRKQVNASYINLKTAAKGDSKSSVRKYYTEAYGDAGYAKELTSGKAEDMDVAYKPKDDTVKENDFKTKDGTGKLSAQDKAIIDAKARRGVELARLAAAAGVIEFNKVEVKKYASSLLEKSDETLAFLEDTLQNLPLVNEAALDAKATIPDADSGVVSNPLQGVRDPKAKADTENIDSNVEKDAKIAKQASYVPQLQNPGAGNLNISSQFTTVEKKFADMNINMGDLKLRKPKYRGRE